MVFIVKRKNMEINFKKILPIILLTVILLTAAFLRLYRIRDYIVFLGDQGRDVLVVKRIIVDRKFTLLGPVASVGGFYLGPFYYYLMALPLWLSGLDPVGPAIMVALFGVATVYFIYLFAKKAMDFQTGIVSAGLYAVSGLAVSQSRFSWNPNTVPFFSILYFYFLYQAGKIHKKIFIFSAGLCLGICFQLHYLTLPLFPIGLLLLADKKAIKWLVNILFLLLGLIVTFSPFIFFEFRHGFNNVKTIWEFVSRKDGAMGLEPLPLIGNFFSLSQKIFANFLNTPDFLTKILVYISLLVLVWGIFKSGKKWFFKILAGWWILGVLILGFYQGAIHNYYYGFLYPVPAIITGVMLGFLLKNKNILLKIFALVFFVYLIYQNLIIQPIIKEPNKILEQTKAITDNIIKESGGKPFNFALLTLGNSDHAYRYFLEISGYRPVTLEEGVQENLFVVCEDSNCEPLGNPLWEVAGFGRAEVNKQWQDKIGIKTYWLVHHADSLDRIGKPAPR